MTKIESKHSVVGRAPYILYMSFTDMRNFVQFLPEDKRKDVTADFDSLSATVQGFNVGVKVEERVPYSRIAFKDNGAPFAFRVTLFFDSHNGAQDETDFHVEVEAELNFMMKMMLGSKIKEGLDKMADALADIAAGKIPEGINPEDIPGYKN